MPQHTDRGYEQQLSQLRASVLEMGGLVEDQIAQAVRALTERNSTLAKTVIDRDHTVNRYDVEVDDLCLKLLALHQPAARDLRLITTALKITTDLERMGFHRRVLQLHLCVVYFFGGIAKSFGADWWNGNSVWRALTRPPFDIISPDFLIRLEYLLPAVGIAICLLETSYPVFIWPRKTRPYWLISILLMHVSIGLTMGLYLFALIMVVLNLAAFGPGVLSVSIKSAARPA